MSDRDRSREQPIEELASLRREVEELQITKAACEAQHELLKSLVSIAKTAAGPLMLKAMLQRTLNIAVRLTDAEDSSLFWLNADGTVIESILARGAIIRDQKQNLIGKVLDKGLAGWVVRHRQAGLISDTLYDERWLTLPSQPYTVRSALSVPIVRGKVLLGILTLMHSQPNHFTSESTHLMELVADRMALVLENAQIYIDRQQTDIEHHQAHPESRHTERQPDKPLLPTEQHIAKALPPREESFLNGESLSLFGVYIIIGYGKFLYANPRLAEIFGYQFDELISLESIFEIVSVGDCSLLAKHMNECFQGLSKSLWCTFKGQRKDGSLIDIEIYGKKTKFYGKSVVIGMLRVLKPNAIAN